MAVSKLRPTNIAWCTCTCKIVLLASRFDPTKWLREKNETINHEFSSKG